MEEKGRLFGSLKNEPSASRKCPKHTAQASFQQRETRLGTLLGSVSWRELVAVAHSQDASHQCIRELGSLGCPLPKPYVRIAPILTRELNQAELYKLLQTAKRDLGQ